MSRQPNIEPLRWINIRDVLPNEAHDFTPWLSENLELLAGAVGLEEVELTGTEHAVDEYRVDIRGVGTDASGEEIALVIENQYGRSDHDHLGKLLTYSARAQSETERVLGVWIVEDPTPAHLAAIEFLNRISADYVGWVLLSVRFVKAPEGYYVHFEKHAEPNEFLRLTSGTTARSVSPERIDFMHALAAAIEPPLRQAGYRHVWAHPDGHLIRAYLPHAIPASRWAELRIRAQQKRVRTMLSVRGPLASPEQNAEILEGIRLRHQEQISERLSEPSALEWHCRSANDRVDFARYSWEGHGYGNTDASIAADRVLEFANACIDVLRQDGEEEFPEPDELAASTNAATVMEVARQILPGEWSTYGEISEAITGSSSTAMAIGNIARTNPDFPTPHRVLNSRGEIPDNWRTTDGTGGPEVCRRLLQDEGVHFSAVGRADPTQRVEASTVRNRWQAGDAGKEAPTSQRAKWNDD